MERVSAFAGDVACCAHLAHAWLLREAGPEAVVTAARRRLADLVAFARERSPFLRGLYASLPAEPALAELPAVTKAQVMANFDAWVTDRHVHRAAVERFVADRGHIGERFRGRYLAWKSSGSTGTPGLFVQDARAIPIYDALVALQWAKVAWNPASLAAGTGRAAVIVATGDHYASVASWERMRREHPGWSGRSFSVLAPLPELVAALNDYRPSMVASYPSVLELLAGERRAGALRIEPRLIWSGGELLAPAARAEIEGAFGCRVVNEYGASECLSIAHGCREGWLHVNADWVVLEAVEADGSPTAPGCLSHTAFLTNLANRIQPLIRYDLGDRIIAKPDACACGDPMPAIRVEGRCDDMLEFAALGDARVRIAPLALATVVEEASDVHRFQLAQLDARHLVLRLERMEPSTRRSAGRRACTALRGYLALQGLASVRVSLDRGPPRVDPRSGKLRSVVNDSGLPGR